MCGETPVRYVYDGSFEGLLCCVYESVYSHMLPQEVVCEADAQPSLFGEVAVRTQPEKAALYAQPPGGGAAGCRTKIFAQ